MQEIAWGIVGCGNVTEVKSGPALQQAPHSSLVAVMRRDAAKAADYAKRHGVPTWYDDADALINDPAVNAIYIATPPDSHEHYALRALAAGKPIYIEKPVALNASSAARIADAAARAGVAASVAHYRREQPYFKKVAALLAKGVIGKPRLAWLQYGQPHQPGDASDLPWRLHPAVSGGGLFHDLAPHALDLFRHFFGRAARVSGLSTNTGGYYEADDSVAGQVLFSSGVFFTGAWCFAARARVDRCTIEGSKGSLSFSIFDGAPVVLEADAIVTEFPFDPLPHVQQPMIEAVMRFFRGDGANPCPVGEAVETMEWIDAMSGRK
jgi:predicted dehydrogenase